MRIHRDSIAWLAAVAVAFTLVLLLFTPLRLSLAWDETVYASQISQHEPIMRWSAERARGMPLLVAPVTLLTSSATVLRVYLALLAGIGIFLAMLAWRGTKPAWILALAGVIFGGLSIVQTQAAQLYPNFWIALGGLATAGLFLRGMTRETPSRPVLALLAVAAAFTALMRPVDGAVICAPLLAIASVLILRHAMAKRSVERRAAGLLVMTAAGLAVGIGEWVAESYMYFGGPVARLHLTSAVVGGTKFDPINSLRILNAGRTSSVAGYPGITGWSYPGLLFWWLAFLLLALLGVWAVSRTQGWVVAATPFACALAVYAVYTLPVRDNARYLQPSWALLAIPAAEGIGWLIMAPENWRRALATTTAIVFVGLELGTQHQVLTGQWAAFESSASANMNAAHALQRLGVHPPCAIATVRRPYFAAVTMPVSYYTGCAYAGDLRDVGAAHGRHVVVLVQGTASTSHDAGRWAAYKLPASGHVTAYLQDGTAASG